MDPTAWIISGSDGKHVNTHPPPPRTLRAIWCCRFSEWPADALKSVASRFLHDVDMPTEETRHAVEDMCMVFHQSVGGAAPPDLRGSCKG